MKKFEFDELIEKAFSIGYEYALEEQKEFGNKENKRKRREWELKNGKKDEEDLSFYEGWLAGKKAAGKTEKGDAYRIMGPEASKIAAARKKARLNEPYCSGTLNERINDKGKAEKDILLKNKEKQVFVGNNRDKRNNNSISRINKADLSFNRLKKKRAIEAEEAEKLDKEIALYRLKNIKRIRTEKNIKRGAALVGGAALIGAAAYGIKKHQDKRRAEKEERRRLEEENKALKEALEMKEKLNTNK